MVGTLLHSLANGPLPFRGFEAGILLDSLSSLDAVGYDRPFFLLTRVVGSISTPFSISRARVNVAEVAKCR